MRCSNLRRASFTHNSIHSQLARLCCCIASWRKVLLLHHKLHGVGMASKRDQQSNSTCFLTVQLHVLLLQGEHVQQLLRGGEGQEGQLNLLTSARV